MRLDDMAIISSFEDPHYNNISKGNIPATEDMYFSPVFHQQVKYLKQITSYNINLPFCDVCFTYKASPHGTG